MNTDTRNAWIGGIIVIIIIGLGIWYFATHETTPAPANEAAQGDEATVRQIVTDFGAKLQTVPLLASKEDAATAIRTNYAPYVSSDLLTQWADDPSKAPGRLTSSPWPARIDIGTVTKDYDGSYVVTGNIVEATSTGDSASYPVEITLRLLNGEWRIADLKTTYNAQPINPADSEIYKG